MILVWKRLFGLGDLPESGGKYRIASHDATILPYACISPCRGRAGGGIPEPGKTICERLERSLKL